MSACLSIHLLLCLDVYMSVCTSAFLSVYLYVHYICTSIIALVCLLEHYLYYSSILSNILAYFHVRVLKYQSDWVPWQTNITVSLYRQNIHFGCVFRIPYDVFAIFP